MAAPNSTVERITALETKMDHIREDVKEMSLQNRQDHARVIEKLERLEGWRNHWLGIIAVLGPIFAYAAAHIDWAQVFR